MEIGSFIELQLPKGKEYYVGDIDVIRLNSGRAAIYHAVRIMNCTAVWIPYYQCETVRNFLDKKGVKIKYYHIDHKFNPVDIDQKDNEAVILVNYFGIMSKSRMSVLSEDYKNVIIDNSQAFFAEPLKGCMNVYSARKFVGVPDGAYVIGNSAHKFKDEYAQCFSSDTAAFLLMRCEYGCEGKTYAARTLNEERIDSEDVMKMSYLTRSILDGTDYELNICKRKENFAFAKELYSGINLLNVETYFDDSCVPMVYPLMIEDETLLKRLIEKKHFQGHWWAYVLNEVEEDTFEYELSKYMVPITIDQRYGKKELEYISEVIL